MLALTCGWLRSAGPPPWDSAALGKRRAQEVRLEVVTAGEMEEREVEEAEQIAEGRGATEFEELLRYVQTHHRLRSVARHVHIFQLRVLSLEMSPGLRLCFSTVP